MRGDFKRQAYGEYVAGTDNMIQSFTRYIGDIVRENKEKRNESDMTIKDLQAYTLKEERQVRELNSTAYIL